MYYYMYASFWNPKNYTSPTKNEFKLSMIIEKYLLTPALQMQNLETTLLREKQTRIVVSSSENASK